MNTRKGSLLIEVTLALSLVGVVAVAVAQLLVISAHQRREASRARIAIRELANQMERVMLLPWEQLSTETIAAQQLSPTAQRHLPEAELAAVIRSTRESLLQKEITLQLGWKNSAGRLTDPVTLSAWRFAEGVRP